MTPEEALLTHCILSYLVSPLVLRLAAKRGWFSGDDWAHLSFIWLLSPLACPMMVVALIALLPPEPPKPPEKSPYDDVLDDWLTFINRERHEKDMRKRLFGDNYPFSRN
jgi:hypothetical protein